MNNPLVSVVIPTYGRIEHLLRALKSVEKQSYDNIEIIVVDDNSPQSQKGELVKQELANIGYSSKYIEHEDNKGANEARKTGIISSTGQYIAFLDDDDYWFEDKIFKQVKAALETEADLIYTGIQFIDSEDNVIKKKIPKELGSDPTEKLLYRNYIGTYSCVMVHSDVIPQVGYPDNNFPAWQDQEWFIRISEHHKLKLVKGILVNYSIDSSDRITDSIIKNRGELANIFISKFRDTAKNRGPKIEKKMLAWVFHRIGNSAFLHSEYPLSIKYQVRSIKYDPLFIRAYLVLIASLFGDSGKYIAYRSVTIISNIISHFRRVDIDRS